MHTVASPTVPMPRATRSVSSVVRKLSSGTGKVASSFDPITLARSKGVHVRATSAPRLSDQSEPTSFRWARKSGMQSSSLVGSRPEGRNQASSGASQRSSYRKAVPSGRQTTCHPVEVTHACWTTNSAVLGARRVPWKLAKRLRSSRRGTDAVTSCTDLSSVTRRLNARGTQHKGLVRRSGAELRQPSDVSTRCDRPHAHDDSTESPGKSSFQFV